ncbi:Presenilin-B [Bienertia sinuspersici]
MRIKVLLEIDKPMRRGIKISIYKSSKWADAKYEQIGDFCFYSGRMGHMDCDY